MYWKDEIYAEDDQGKKWTKEKEGERQTVPTIEEMLCVSMTTRHAHTTTTLNSSLRPLQIFRLEVHHQSQ